LTFCSKCGFKLQENLDYCSKCGKQIIKQKIKSSLDLRLINFIETGKRIDWKDISADHKTELRKQLMAYQRIFHLSEDTADSLILLGRGFDSAVIIADKTEEEFIKAIGLDTDKARIIYENSWKWRKKYMMWDANRKMFLYPENYIEPDLQDNKTQIFKELEDELLQNKITEDHTRKTSLKIEENKEKHNKKI